MSFPYNFQAQISISDKEYWMWLSYTSLQFHQQFSGIDLGQIICTTNFLPRRVEGGSRPGLGAPNIAGTSPGI